MLPAEKHPLEPFLPKNATLLMLGSFPPPRARWTMDFYYPNFQNDMWRIVGLTFFDDRNYFVAAGGKAFDEEKLRAFLADRGIALYDTATKVIRQKGNASDQFLEIVETIDFQEILNCLPICHTVVTTGQKATETLMSIVGVERIPPLCKYAEVCYNGRLLRCYRMPSSSRAYPRRLEDKAADYRRMFEEAGII